MPFQRINDVDFYYEDEGTGATVLLLHGAFGTARAQFGDMIEFLADRGYRVIAPDMRGYGRSRPPERDYPLDFYRRDMTDISDLLTTLGLAPAHVIGISDGGIIGLLLAVERPELVCSLVAWAANTDFPAEERELYTNILDAGYSNYFFTTMRERHGMSKLEAQKMLQGFVDTSLAISDTGYDVGLGERLSEIKRPTLVGAGALGDFLPLHHAQRQNKLIANSQLWIVPRVGHFWPLTNEGRQEFAERVINWLSQNGAACPPPD